MFGDKFAKPLRLPRKLKNRERAMRLVDEDSSDIESTYSGSYVFCRDGTLIPIDDPELLDIINRTNTPE
ncbi:MAG: hypothetical protein RLP44_10190 [Aggregatilineales bacterium]